MSQLIVQKPGVQSTIQDEGRLGVLHEGIAESGSMDRWSARCANALCSNFHQDAVIEVTLGGLELRVEGDIVIAITGGFATLQINGEYVEMWRSHKVTEGDTIQLGFCKKGARLYLAASGGIQSPQTLNSRSTTVQWGIGGLSGGALTIGDTLPCSPPRNEVVRRLSVSKRPKFRSEVNLAVLPCSQSEHFAEEQRNIFFSSLYQVDQRCNRMGYRIVGEPIKPPSSRLYSEGLVCGAIQLPPDGQPFVLMRDHQSIGGYPKIGIVIGSGVDRLAQCIAGQRIRFTPKTNQQATQIISDYTKGLNDLPLLIGK